MKLIKFQELDKKRWNDNLSSMSGNLHYATWQIIEYFSEFEKVENLSFSLFEGKKCLAMIPLGVTKSEDGKNTLSFGNSYCTSPVVNKNLSNYEARKLQTNIRLFVEETGKKNCANFYKLRSHPVYFEQNKPLISSANQFYQLKWAEEFFVHNTIIIDLNYSLDSIWNDFSKYHKKNIKKISNKNLKFNVLNKKSKKTLIDEQFKKFKNAHFRSAKRMTRSNSSWSKMKDMILNGESILFYMTHKNVEISYLYCGTYKKFSWGWTQVNLDEFEKEFMPRHILEWLTIKYFKKQKYKFYEIGERYFSYKNFKPTEKEESISEFKEKFGGKVYPRVYFSSKL
tara:strand:- start:782 stop:1801 length:1020 start_codon:yes stop_codon:yes gene_type:complete